MPFHGEVNIEPPYLALSQRPLVLMRPFQAAGNSSPLKNKGKKREKPHVAVFVLSLLLNLSKPASYGSLYKALEMQFIPLIAIYL